MKFDIDNIKNKIEQDDNYLYFYSSYLEDCPLWALDEMCNFRLNYYCHIDSFIKYCIYWCVDKPFRFFRYKIKKEILKAQEFFSFYDRLPVEVDREFCDKDFRKLIMLHDFK